MRHLLSVVYSDSQEQTLAICLQIVNMLSFFSCLTVIFIYTKYESVRSLATRLFYWIAIAGIIGCIGNFLSIAGSLPAGPLCIMQAFLLQIASLAVLLWSVLVTWVIYKILLDPNGAKKFHHDIDAWWYKIHAIIWSFCVLTAVIPLFIKDAYGPTGGTCWITLDSSVNQALRYALFYVLWLLCILVMVVLSFRVTRFVYINQYRDQSVSTASKDNASRIIRTVWYYPLVVLFFNLFFAIRRSDELIKKGSSHFVWAVLSILFGYSRQVPNTVIFCLTTNVKQVLREMCGSGQAHVEPNEEEEEEENMHHEHDEHDQEQGQTQTA